MAVGSAAVAASAFVLHRTKKADTYRTNSRKQRPRLPEWARWAIAGAAGEVGGQILLYPSEVIKVLCQHSGQNAWVVTKTLLSTKGPVGALGVLLNGAPANIGISAFLGAAYLSIFRVSTVVFTRLSLGQSTAAQEEQKVAKMAMEMSGDGVADMSAAIVTALITALVTGPLEMARNRVQSGAVSGTLSSYILNGRGIRDTVPYLVPFIMVSAPHDFAELVTVCTCNRLTEAHFRHLPLPRECFDAASGALAGITGVLLSAPMDCIKTKMVTASCGSDFGRPDLNWATATVRAKWLATAEFTWRTQGARGFLVGTLPRLLDDVPGAMLHWMLVEATLRALP